MLTMMLAAAFATALAADPTSVTSDPPALPVASAPPPGAAPGARIFSYADLKAMDAKASDRASPSVHADPAHVHAPGARRGRREPVRHVAASPPMSHPPVSDPAALHAASPHAASPSLRPAFALEKTTKVTR